MAKVLVPLEKLPYPGNDGKHKVRFRITTKDYNEISEWSPVFLLDSTGQVIQVGASAQYSYNISTSTSGRKMIDLSWEDPHSSVDQNTHDIFIRYIITAAMLGLLFCFDQPHHLDHQCSFSKDCCKLHKDYYQIYAMPPYYFLSAHLKWNLSLIL